MTEEEHRLANAEPTEQPVDQDEILGGTGVEQFDLDGDEPTRLMTEGATLTALEKAFENYPGEPKGEVTITVTVTDA